MGFEESLKGSCTLGYGDDKACSVESVIVSCGFTRALSRQFWHTNSHTPPVHSAVMSMKLWPPVRAISRSLRGHPSEHGLGGNVACTVFTLIS